jgi:hypothetical protein
LHNSEHSDSDLLALEYQVYSSDPEASKFKIKALRTAMSAIENLPFKVQRMEDVDKVLADLF